MDLICRSTYPGEIVTFLFNIKSNMFTGFDNFDSQIIRKITSKIALLNVYFNSNFSSGVVPHELKIANVIPLHKRNDPPLVFNY